MRSGTSRFGTKLLSALSSFALFSGIAYGGTISGVVKSPDGAPFEGAFVQAQNTKSHISVYVLSQPDGHYEIGRLPAGDYNLRIRAVGYKAEPKTGLALASENARSSADFSLQKAPIRWSDATIYQGIKLLPDAPGRKTFLSQCLGCHGFQSRMAAEERDQDGWRDRVNYMRYTMFVGITDKQADEAVSYLTAMFNPDSTLPRSPADMPGYKDLVQHFPPEALNMVYVEYDTGPGRFPWDCNPDKDGNIWVPYYSQVNTVARLNPKTGEFKEYPLPQQPRVAIHSAYPGPDGNVWFTEQLNNRLGKIDPQTGEVTEYQDVKPSNRERIGDTESNVSIYYRPHEPSKHTIRVDPRGIVWASGTPFSRFDPKTKQFTEYPDPFNTYGVALNKDGSEVWFDGFVPEGKIYRIDALTGKITGSWQPPTHGLPRRIQVADDGIVWFNEFEGGKIGRFDPKTETFKEFQLPGGHPTPYALGIDRDNMVWYSSEDMDEVGRLDPNTGKITEYPFPHMENKMREFTMDAQGRMWWASPANNKVGYFYLANSKERASN